MIQKYLIQHTYGITNPHNILMSGLSIWTLEYDGTPEGLQSAFLDAQNKSPVVSRYKEMAKPYGLENNGTWLVFSVVQNFKD